MDKDHTQHDERANETPNGGDADNAVAQLKKRAYDEGYRDGSRRVIKTVREILRDTNNDNEGALLQITAVLDKIDVH